MLLLVRRKGHQVLGKSDPDGAIVTGRRGDTGEEMTVTFTVDDAKRAGLTSKKGNVWSHYPQDMLYWRAISRLCRRLFTDCLGAYSAPTAVVMPDFGAESPMVKLVNGLLADVQKAYGTTVGWQTNRLKERFGTDQLDQIDDEKLEDLCEDLRQALASFAVAEPAVEEAVEVEAEVVAEVVAEPAAVEVEAEVVAPPPPASGIDSEWDEDDPERPFSSA